MANTNSSMPTIMEMLILKPLSEMKMVMEISAEMKMIKISVMDR
jgi:hypothetical protein